MYINSGKRQFQGEMGKRGGGGVKSYGCRGFEAGRTDDVNKMQRRSIDKSFVFWVWNRSPQKQLVLLRNRSGRRLFYPLRSFFFNGGYLRERMAEKRKAGAISCRKDFDVALFPPDQVMKQTKK